MVKNDGTHKWVSMISEILRLAAACRFHRFASSGYPLGGQLLCGFLGNVFDNSLLWWPKSSLLLSHLVSVPFCVYTSVFHLQCTYCTMVCWRCSTLCAFTVLRYAGSRLPSVLLLYQNMLALVHLQCSYDTAVCWHWLSFSALTVSQYVGSGPPPLLLNTVPLLFAVVGKPLCDSWFMPSRVHFDTSSLPGLPRMVTQ